MNFSTVRRDARRGPARRRSSVRIRPRRTSGSSCAAERGRVDDVGEQERHALPPLRLLLLGVPSGARAPSVGSCRRIACSSCWSSSTGRCPSSSTRVSRARRYASSARPGGPSGRAPASAGRVTALEAGARRRTTRARRRAAVAPELELGVEEILPEPRPATRPGGLSPPARRARTRDRPAAGPRHSPRASRKLRGPRLGRFLAPHVPVARSGARRRAPASTLQHVAGSAGAEEVSGRAPCAARRRGSGVSRPQPSAAIPPRAPRPGGRWRRPRLREGPAGRAAPRCFGRLQLESGARRCSTSSGPSNRTLTVGTCRFYTVLATQYRSRMSRV